jgi:hypothetical protein
MAAMMIYAGAGQLHKMPNIGQDINWIPVDICSSALIDLALKSSLDISTHVYHLINPNTITYDEYLHSLRQAGFTFECVSPNEFINSISNTNPLIKLSSFFEQIYLNKSNFTRFQTEKTESKCHILKNCPKIDSNLIKLYLNYWKHCQIFK